MKIETIREFKKIKDISPVNFLYAEDYDLIIHGNWLDKYLTVWRFSTGQKVCVVRLKKEICINAIRRIGKWLFIVAEVAGRYTFVLDLETLVLRELMITQGPYGSGYVGAVDNRAYFAYYPGEELDWDDFPKARVEAYAFDLASGDFSREPGLDPLFGDLGISAIGTKKCVGRRFDGSRRLIETSYDLDNKGMPSSRNPLVIAGWVVAMTRERWVTMEPPAFCAESPKFIRVYDARMGLANEIVLPGVETVGITLYPVDEDSVPTGWLVVAGGVVSHLRREVVYEFSLYSKDFGESRWHHRMVDIDDAGKAFVKHWAGVHLGEHVVYAGKGRLIAIEVASGRMCEIPLEHDGIYPTTGMLLPQRNVGYFGHHIYPPPPTPYFFWRRKSDSALCYGRLVD